MEHPARYGGKRNPGKFDAMLETNSGPIVLEWETGNISSSHRSLNKMALGITRGEILGGILVVRSRAFAQYQTLSLARRPACVVKGTPSYIVGQAWSLPSYRRVGVPAHARLRGRCSRRATTGSAFSSEFQRSQHEPSLFAAQSPLFQKPNHPALSAFRTLRFESPILRSHIQIRV